MMNGGGMQQLGTHCTGNNNKTKSLKDSHLPLYICLQISCHRFEKHQNQEDRSAIKVFGEKQVNQCTLAKL